MLKSKCLKTHYSESICMAERIIKLRQYVQFDFYTVNEMFVLQLFEKEDCANDGKDCIWEDDHFDFVMLFEQAITWCKDRYCNLRFPGESEEGKNMDTNKVTVRWWDGYMEDFDATEVRFGMSRESHQN